MGVFTSVDYSKALKGFRKSADMTQEDLAHELNMTQSHVSKYEQGRKIVDLETFVRWAQVTNSEVQAAMIMFGADIFAHAAQVVSLVPAFINFSLFI